MPIGLYSAMPLVLNGCMAGIRDIAGAMVRRWTTCTAWKAASIIGLMLGPLAFADLAQRFPAMRIGASVPVLAGLSFGFGTRFGSGCRNGHGNSGLVGRLPRPSAAIETFTVTAAATVFLVRHILGGS